MWRILKRKHAENSDAIRDEIPHSHETSDEEAQAPDQCHCITSSKKLSDVVLGTYKFYLALPKHLKKFFFFSLNQLFKNIYTIMFTT